MRTLLQYLILGLVFVPTLMLLVDAKARPAGLLGDPARPPTSRTEPVPYPW